MLRGRSVVAQAVRVIAMVMLFATIGWIYFAATLEDIGEDGSDNGMPFVSSKRGRPRRSPGPVVKPATDRPPYREWLGDDYNIRRCECRKDWQELPLDTPGLCRCRGICPSYVTPVWLTEAAGQALCSLEEKTGYNCYAECQNEKADVGWFAIPCGGKAQEQCEPAILAKRKLAAQKPVAAAAEKAPVKAAAKDDAEAQRAAKAAVAAEAEAKKKKADEEAKAKARAALPPLDYDAKDVYDLRGLQCELLDGKTQCYYEDSQGRELCPSFVTPDWLAFPKNQYLCSHEMAHEYYCTAGCQEGNPEVRWGAHERIWCNRNKGACPAIPSVIPKKDFKLKNWSAKPEKPRPCRDAWAKGEKPPGVIPKVTAGMLTHEPKSMADSLATYEKLGLFEVFSEFLVYVNKRRPEVDAVLDPYVAKYKSVKVMGDANNYGIARGMSFLTGNSSNPFFLFLERDFQLVEPATCVYEEIDAGRKLLEQKTAHVIRYRHRRHPGRPNWAEKMYKGREDDVFKSAQPNLFCNHFYWYEEPEKRWPDKIWVCNENPAPMWCSDSYYCNWTNNPQLWEVAWWNKEYVHQWELFKRNDPYYDLETYMNWEPNAWNSRKFTVAQGEGLFKHVDRGNFGIA